jgi:hypothetical protein
MILSSSSKCRAVMPTNGGYGPTKKLTRDPLPRHNIFPPPPMSGFYADERYRSPARKQTRTRGSASEYLSSSSMSGFPCKRNVPSPTGTKPRGRGAPRDNIVPLSQSGFECQRTVSRPDLEITAGTREPAYEYLSSSSSWVRRPSSTASNPTL